MSGDGSSQVSVRHARYGDDEAGREHRRRDRDGRHHRDHDERRRKNRVNIMDFMKIGPPPLIGYENADVAEAWVDIMEQCFRVLHYDEDEKMEITDFMIQGKAQKWWKPVSVILGQQHGRIGWEHFRQAFINHHFPPALCQAKEMEMLIMKQRDSNIEDYQKRFTDMLSYAPHISENSATKYSHFLNGLNKEIFYQVSICDDPTSYEGLVNRFRQAEISISRKKAMQASKSSSSLGPRGQSFKKSVSSSYSSGSGGVHSFGRKKMQCGDYGCNHQTENCRRETGACFNCGSFRHTKRDCPNLENHSGGRGSCRGRISQGSQQRPRVQEQVFALNQEQAEEQNERVIAASMFVKKHKLPYVSLDVLMSVSTPKGQEVLAKRLVVDCLLEFEEKYLSANLMILAMEDFDCIMGISLLTKYRAPDVIDVKNISAVDEFPDVFLDEIPGFPPEREVEAEIELVPGTVPISRAPYRSAPTEMKELKQQLQDLLDKVYIRPSVSSWGAPVLFVKKRMSLRDFA
ncbi:uncharacterized protein [Primulina eburnea]|uniref:uncharacterized protein n=1 Tax=Primulina eburnea TaxID=1245227 RepID=UPI003C6C792C